MTRLDESAIQKVRPTLNDLRDGTRATRVPLHNEVRERAKKARHCTNELRNTRPFLSPAASSRPENLNSSVLTRTHSSGSEPALAGLEFSITPFLSYRPLLGGTF